MFRRNPSAKSGECRYLRSRGRAEGIADHKRRFHTNDTADSSRRSQVDRRVRHYNPGQHLRTPSRRSHLRCTCPDLLCSCPRDIERSSNPHRFRIAHRTTHQHYTPSFAFELSILAESTSSVRCLAAGNAPLSCMPCRQKRSLRFVSIPH